MRETLTIPQEVVEDLIILSQFLPHYIFLACSRRLYSTPQHKHRLLSEKNIVNFTA